MSKQDFMTALREQWEAQPTEQYEFLGLTGMDYNDWLEHRHGWPVGNDGNCLVHSELDEFPAEDCTVCTTLLRRYEQEHGADDDVEKLKLEISRLERRLGAYEGAVKRLIWNADNGDQVNRDLDAEVARANEQHDTALTKLLVSRNTI
ncbi:hypothetical protein [Streptomyces sp. NPDC057253]|uniref:hypothetical protein n=1 Tax=Streptomyces sp. NPDC057253 TaxID=3346069 RepID=UPI0036397791